MSTAPLRVHRMAKEEFTVPQQFQFDLFPSFHRTSRWHPQRRHPARAVLSRIAPDHVDQNAILRLRRLPIPEAKIIRKLAEFSRQGWLDGNRSVMYSHLSEGVVTHFPLWVLTYWTMILDFKRDVRAYWVRSLDWVAKQKKTSKKNPAWAVLVKETTHILGMLPWGWAKPPGLSDSEPAHNLWRFLGPHWLAGSQQNNMLELLRHKVDSDPELAKKFRIQGIALSAKILEAHKAGCETYKSSQSTAHLGQINNKPHWIGFVFDFSHPTAVIHYGDSFGEPMPASLLAACRWWIAQHSEAQLVLKDLPISTQSDGFSCGMLVDNSLQHFVDSQILLSMPSASFVDARLEAFNKIGRWTLDRLEVARALAVLEDEDSDDRSDYCAATPVIPSDSKSDSQCDSDAPFLLQHTARRAKFTFTASLSISPSQSDAPTTTAGVKRAKGHPDAPTPNPSPQKHRIYKRDAESTLRPPTPPRFSPVVARTRRRRSADVFGSLTGYGTDSESAAEGDDARGGATAGDPNKYVWGPEDDAPLPPDSQLSEFDNTESRHSGLDNASLHIHNDDMPRLIEVSCSEDDDETDSDIESVASGMPGLEDVDNSDVEPLSDSNNDLSPVSSGSRRSCRPQKSGCTRPKITSFFKVETAAEKAVRLERDNREFAERAEETRLRETNAICMKAARIRADGREHVQRSRARKREQKIAGGWIPGQKREEPFHEVDVYDDCNIPLNVVSGLLASGSSSVTPDFAVSEDGGLPRSGDAEKSDVEEELEAAPSAPLGRGQRKKIVPSRYQGSLWEQH
ncbi:hypothetical protein B0H14DRAFT_3574828 [Mycena olivaceomarginata]|nr:hypothetical protein B0H14DRAFT_3574828 [Mycena olivaceomarginata]